MQNQRGMTLVELVVVVAMASLLLLAATSFAVPWLNRESMRSGIYDVQTYMQLARIEAISRNRQCRFVVDVDNRTLEVYDGMSTPGNLLDDELLYDATLPSRITFSRPDAGAAVTLSQIGASNSFETVFNSDGSVSSGIGEVVLFGGQRFGRIAVFGAGGTQVTRWNNGAWHAGS